MARAGEQRQQIDAVRQAFADDPDIAPHADALHIEPGDPWRVSGEVGSVVARRKAVRVARRTLPGEDFEDGVRLSPALRRSDESLCAALLEALRHEPAFAEVPVLETGERPPHHDAHWIAVMVRDGSVYLGGRLDLAGRSLAEGIAWETGACCDVRNLISHEPARADPDDELASAVKTLIEQHTTLDPVSVAVSVDHGEVELTGEVPDPRQRETLVGLCWLLPGVAEVRDRLGPAGA
jgi:osmotically-inducible protein OsmY